MPDGIRRSSFALAESGITISALDWGGDGALAILHHANGFCGALWAPVAEMLSGNYRVVALDARGHGDSCKPTKAEAYRWESFADDLIAVSDRLLAETEQKAVGLVVGHSFGGTASLVAAAKRPRLFRRLVLVDPVVPPPPELQGKLDGRQAALLLAANARRRRRIWGSREEAKRAWRGRSFFSSWDQRVLELYLSEGMVERQDGQVELKCPPEVEALIFEAGTELDLYSFAREVSVPALILHAGSGSFPREFHEALAASLGNARLEIVDASHLLPMEEPRLVAEAALRFAR